MPAEDYLAIRAAQEEPTEFRDGFGLKAVLTGLFIAFLVVPGAMFMFLMMGADLAPAALWVALIISLEIAKRCRATLSKQEMFIIWSVTMAVMAAGVQQFLSFIWMQYFVRSDAAVQFEIVNRLPYWIAPPPGSEAYTTRSLLHHDWWPHLTIMGLLIVWNRLSRFSLGYVMYRITSDVEKLPFPLAPIAAQGIMALAESEQETWRWRCFSIGSTIGIMFALIYVSIPALSGIFLRDPLYLLPVPFFDLTTKVQDIKFLRAVPLALSTNLAHVFTGFVLPFWMVVGSFTAGVVGRLAVNPILYHYGVLQMWEPGMDYIETDIANRFDFWLSFGVGTAVAVALIGVYSIIKELTKADRPGRRAGAGTFATPKGRGDIPMPIAILFFVAKTSWLIMLCHILVPRFPLWILIGFGFGYTPIMSYIGARLNGLAGQTIPIPYVKEAAFVLSGYKGVDIWYAPVPLGDVSQGAHDFRVCELTGTKLTSAYKAELFAVPLGVVASLFFWSFIYKMSEVPEDYPYAARFWVRDAALGAMWMSATTTGNAFFLKAFKFEVVGAGLCYGLLIYPIMRLIGAPTLFLYGTIVGLIGDPMMLFPQFVAALVGRFYMAKVFGEERWRKFTPVLAAGFGCGLGLVSMVSIAVRLISSAITMLPF